MITGALINYLQSNISGVTFHVERAPIGSGIHVTIDDNGDDRDRHWQAGVPTTGLKEQNYELSVWASMDDGGTLTANQHAQAIIDALDNFKGSWIDTASSPNVTHRIAMVQASSAGGGFDAGPEMYAHSVFLTIYYD